MRALPRLFLAAVFTSLVSFSARAETLTAEVVEVRGVAKGGLTYATPHKLVPGEHLEEMSFIHTTPGSTAKIRIGKTLLHIEEDSIVLVDSARRGSSRKDPKNDQVVLLLEKGSIVSAQRSAPGSVLQVKLRDGTRIDSSNSQFALCSSGNAYALAGKLQIRNAQFETTVEDRNGYHPTRGVEPFSYELYSDLLAPIAEKQMTCGASEHAHDCSPNSGEMKKKSSKRSKAKATPVKVESGPVTRRVPCS
jgi:hypothetical protein